MSRFPPAITLRQIQYFLAAAEALHFTNAAERLSVTQPTLSHQIAQLEAQLGILLFDRIGKGVRLTEPGVLLEKYLARAVGELEAGNLALSELEDLDRGELRIGVIQSFSRTLLPPLLGRFMMQYPRVRLVVRELTGLEIENGLTAGSLDLGIAFAPAAFEGTEVEPMLEERLLLVVGPTHAFVDRTSVQLSELHEQPVVLLGQDFSTRQIIDRYFSSVGAIPDVVCETNSIEIMLGAVAHSSLATLVPEYALPADMGNRKAITLINPTPVRTSALLWPRHGFRSASARRFAQGMRDRLLSAR